MREGAVSRVPWGVAAGSLPRGGWGKADSRLLGHVTVLRPGKNGVHCVLFGMLLPGGAFSGEGGIVQGPQQCLRQGFSVTYFSIFFLMVTYWGVCVCVCILKASLSLTPDFDVLAHCAV